MTPQQELDDLVKALDNEKSARAVESDCSSAEPEDRLKRECERLYNDAHDCMIECLEPENVDYQSGVKAAMLALYFRITGKTLVVPDLIVVEPSPAVELPA